MTQPPELLLQRDCTGKVPVLSEIFAEAPVPELIQAHLSPFSLPLLSSQPTFGKMSVSVSANSWPPTMVMPAFGPRPLKFAPQLEPALVIYGIFVYAILP